VLLHLHSGWDTQSNTGWNDTNITAGIANDTPNSAKLTVTMTLHSWATGQALQSWNSTGTIPAYSSRNFTKEHRKAFLGSHAATSVFLTATTAVHSTVAEDYQGEEDTTTAKMGGLKAHHFFTKMKAAELRDPQIKLVFGGSGGKLSVTLSCVAPAPNVFIDPGMLLGHFDDNGVLLLPNEPRTLIFDAMDQVNVTIERLQAEVVARSPWSTLHPAF
jgi:hypothetical protein